MITEACEHVAGVHDRMPAILPRDDWTDWLDGPLDAAGLLCRPYEWGCGVERAGRLGCGGEGLLRQ
ncbi:MAG: SOS response-associated peptidase family protein [Bacillota bacterium]